MSYEEPLKVGSIIKEVRKSKGISQTFMAEEVLGIKRSTYSNYENDNRSPDLETLKKIAIALEINISDILGIDESERMKFESDFDIKDLDPEILKIFNDFKEEFTKNTSVDTISNSDFMQNMIIDYLARYKAEVKAYNYKLFDEFIIVDGKLYTGKKQFDNLFNRYYKEFMDDLRESSLDHLDRIVIHEDLENPSSGFLKMLKDHVNRFGEDTLYLNLKKVYRNNFEKLPVKEGE